VVETGPHAIGFNMQELRPDDIKRLFWEPIPGAAEGKFAKEPAPSGVNHGLPVYVRKQLCEKNFGQVIKQQYDHHHNKNKFDYTYEADWAQLYSVVAETHKAHWEKRAWHEDFVWTFGREFVLGNLQQLFSAIAGMVSVSATARQVLESKWQPPRVLRVTHLHGQSDLAVYEKNFQFHFLDEHTLIAHIDPSIYDGGFHEDKKGDQGSLLGMLAKHNVSLGGSGGGGGGGGARALRHQWSSRALGVAAHPSWKPDALCPGYNTCEDCKRPYIPWTDGGFHTATLCAACEAARQERIAAANNRKKAAESQRNFEIGLGLAAGMGGKRHH